MRHAVITFFSAVLLTSACATGALAWGAIAVDDHDSENPEDAGYALITDNPSRAGASVEALS